MSPSNLPSFSGVFTALVTPFTPDGQLDEPSFVRHVETQIRAGVSGLVPVGTTGETSTLSHEEHHRVVSLCIEAAAGRVRVLAGAGSNNTAEAIDLARHAHAAGADGVLVVAPYYNKPSQEGLYQHYKAIHDAVEIPVVLYNVPGRTVVDLSNETVARLAQLPRIAGIKDATGSMERLSQMRLEVPEAFACLSGDDPSLLGYMAHGGHGVISVTSNLAPEAMVSLCLACQQGAYERARQIQDQLITLHKVLFADSSPAPAKYGLSLMGQMGPEVRLPIAPCAEAVRPRVAEAMRRAGLEF